MAALEIKQGTTFRVAFRFGENYGTDDETIYDDSDISVAVFRIRSSDHTMVESLTMTYADNQWSVLLSPLQTSNYHRHRALYWAVDTTFASGDVVREAEGPLRVRAIGG